MELKRLFEESFNQSSEEASSLMSSSTYILADGEAVFQSPDQVLEKSFYKFTPEQKASSIEMLERISVLGGAPSKSQEDFILKVRSVFETENPSGSWQ